MLVLNANTNLDKITQYIHYLDTESHYSVFDLSNLEWVDLLNNRLETKLCMIFNTKVFDESFFKQIADKINIDLYQNLEKSVIFFSDESLFELPQNNNLPCFVITNIKQELDTSGIYKKLSDDDFYFQLTALLNIISDNLKDFPPGGYYGITSSGFFYNQVNNISEVLSDSVLKIIADHLPDSERILYEKFISLKNNLEMQHNSIVKNVTFERIFRYAKDGVVSQINDSIDALWKGKLLENILVKNLNPPDFQYDEQMIGVMRRKLINTLNKLTYYSNRLIFDYEVNCKLDKAVFDPKLQSFYDIQYLKLLQSEKKFYVALTIWLVLGFILTYIAPSIISFAAVGLAILIILVILYFIPRNEFKNQLDILYKDLEREIHARSKKYIESNQEWIVVFARTQVEKYFEEINPKYGESLTFLDSIPANKIYNFLFNYWEEISSNETVTDEKLSEKLNKDILTEENNNLNIILKRFSLDIGRKIFELKNKPKIFWNTSIEQLISRISKKANYLSGKNLLNNVEKSPAMIIEQGSYRLFVPKHLKNNLQLNFRVEKINYLNSKNMFFLSWVERYSRNNLT